MSIDNSTSRKISPDITPMGNRPVAGWLVDVPFSAEIRLRQQLAAMMPMNTKYEIYAIAPSQLPKRWAIGQIIEGCSDLEQFEIVNQDETGERMVILRRLPVGERIDRALVMGELKAEPSATT
jgi:hypothetical protein